MLYLNGDLVATTSNEATLSEDAWSTEIGNQLGYDANIGVLGSSASRSADEALGGTSSTITCQMYTGAEGEEPPAHVSADEADRISRELWATGVESRVALADSSWTASYHGESLGRDNSLVLLTFGRFPNQVKEALMQTDIAASLISQGGDVQPSWTDGKFVLADGVDEHSVSEARDAWHVAVREADEDQIYEAFKNLPYNIRPRAKLGCRFPIPEDSTLFGNLTAESGSEVGYRDESMASSDSSSTLGAPVIHIRRTFLHIPPSPMASLSPRTSRTA